MQQGLLAEKSPQGLCAEKPQPTGRWGDDADDVCMRQGSRPVMTEQERLRRKELRRRPRMVTRARILGFLITSLSVI